MLVTAESRHLSTLLALNLRLRGHAGPDGDRAPGLRDKPAWCVARDGRLVSFARPHDIQPFLRRCVSEWEALAARRPGLRETAEGAARFWLAFICAHPFFDGNGRTAKAFLRLELERLGCRLRGFDLIDRYLIEGRPEDLDRLTALFLVSLESTSQGGSA